VRRELFEKHNYINCLYKYFGIIKQPRDLFL
jgi:hypothetical protein